MSLAPAMLGATLAAAAPAVQGEPDLVGLFRAVCIDRMPAFADSGAALERAGFAAGPALANGARAYTTPDRVYVGMVDRDLARGAERASVCSLGVLGPRAATYPEIEASLGAAVASRAGEAAEHACQGQPAAQATCIWSWAGEAGCEGVQAQVADGRVIGLMAVASAAATDCAEAVK